MKMCLIESNKKKVAETFTLIETSLILKKIKKRLRCFFLSDCYVFCTVKFERGGSEEG